jgi:hypothetical protein
MLNTKTAHMPSQVALRLAQEATLKTSIQILEGVKKLNQESPSPKLSQTICTIEENIREILAVNP